MQNGSYRHETLNIDKQHETGRYWGGLVGISCFLLLIRVSQVRDLYGLQSQIRVKLTNK